jgi:outer membrane protein OmpA-like peptidoglycan-associated protein
MSMKFMRRIEVVMVVVACGLVLGTGCRTRKPKLATHDMLVPEALEGDVALGDRFEEGTRITDVHFDNVHFAYDSYQITSAESPKLERVGEYMRANRNVRLVCEGHCDERGSQEYNMSLGEHRSLAARAYLVGLGIDGSRIQTRSFGEEQPLDSGHGEAAWQINRRVEFALYR